MKNTIVILLVTAFSYSSFSQINTTILDENNVGATLSNDGIFFSSYEWPKESGVNAMKGLSLWFAGKNVNGQLYTSTATEDMLWQQFIGPLTVTAPFEYGEASSIGYEWWTNSFFPVTRQEIDNHIANNGSPGYTIPESISNWPAHGNLSLGASYYLAPYVDVNGDNMYTPEQGDFPCIKGDKAVYMVMNDVSQSSGCGPMNFQSLGLEIHYMFYQYETTDALNNVTFCNARVINRSTSTYFNFKSSLFLNGQIGNPSDDFAGTNVSRNLIYSYNGNPEDLSDANYIGYGNQPPAVGVVSLNHPINRSRVFQDFLNYNYTFPTEQVDFWNVMNGAYYDGTPDPIQFGYDGDPYLNTGVIATLPEGRVAYTIDKDVLVPGEIIQFDFAVVTSQGNDHLQSVEKLFEDVDYVQAFYNSDNELCHQEILSINEPIELGGITTYPNPSHGIFNLKVDEGLIGSKYFITDIRGRIVAPIQAINSSVSKVTLNQTPGIYLINITNDFSTVTYKILIE